MPSIRETSNTAMVLCVFNTPPVRFEMSFAVSVQRLSSAAAEGGPLERRVGRLGQVFITSPPTDYGALVRLAVTSASARHIEMAPAITAGTAKKYFHARTALTTNATKNEATIGRTRNASALAMAPSCHSATACTSR